MPRNECPGRADTLPSRCAWYEHGLEAAAAEYCVPRSGSEGEGSTLLLVSKKCEGLRQNVEVPHENPQTKYASVDTRPFAVCCAGGRSASSDKQSGRALLIETCGAVQDPFAAVPPVEVPARSL